MKKYTFAHPHRSTDIIFSSIILGPITSEDNDAMIGPIPEGLSRENQLFYNRDRTKNNLKQESETIKDKKSKK
ncbi:MAG TPA: hypothetical protein ENK91_11175 [Bacteroidetes bacterium]|nr:hypothetical protein [Bacteroidota bacterium]